MKGNYEGVSIASIARVIFGEYVVDVCNADLHCNADVTLIMLI